MFILVKCLPIFFIVFMFVHSASATRIKQPDGSLECHAPVDVSTETKIPYWCYIQLDIEKPIALSIPGYPLQSTSAMERTSKNDFLVYVMDTSLFIERKDVPDLIIDIFWRGDYLGSYRGQKPDGRFAVGSTFRVLNKNVSLTCGSNN